MKVACILSVASIFSLWCSPGCGCCAVVPDLTAVPGLSPLLRVLDLWEGHSGMFSFVDLMASDRQYRQELLGQLVKEKLLHSPSCPFVVFLLPASCMIFMPRSRTDHIGRTHLVIFVPPVASC